MLLEDGIVIFLFCYCFVIVIVIVISVIFHLKTMHVAYQKRRLGLIITMG